MNRRTRSWFSQWGLRCWPCRLPDSLAPNVSQQARSEHGVVDAKMESMVDSNADSPVHTIVMLHDEPVFPPGPGRDEFVTACVVCHSAPR